MSVRQVGILFCVAIAAMIPVESSAQYSEADRRLYGIATYSDPNQGTCLDADQLLGARTFFAAYQPISATVYQEFGNVALWVGTREGCPASIDPHSTWVEVGYTAECVLRDGCPGTNENNQATRYVYWAERWISRQGSVVDTRQRSAMTEDPDTPVSFIALASDASGTDWWVALGGSQGYLTTHQSYGHQHERGWDLSFGGEIGYWASSGPSHVSIPPTRTQASFETTEDVWWNHDWAQWLDSEIENTSINNMEWEWIAHEEDGCLSANPVGSCQ